MTIPATHIPASAVTRQPLTLGRQPATADDPLSEHPAFADVLDEQASEAGGPGTADLPSTAEPRPDTPMAAPGAWPAQLAFAAAITTEAPGEPRRTSLMRAAPDESHAATAESRARTRWPGAARMEAAVRETSDLGPARMPTGQSGERDGNPPTPGQPQASAATGGDGAMALANAAPPSPAQQIIAHLKGQVREAAATRLEPAAGQPVRQLRITLQPEELGGVHISLRMTGKRLTIDIRADRSDAAQLLGRETAVLSAALSGPGVVDPSCSVHILVSATAASPAQTPSASDVSAMPGRGLAQNSGEGSGQGGHQHRQPDGEPNERLAKAQPQSHSAPESLLVL